MKGVMTMDATSTIRISHSSNPRSTSSATRSSSPAHMPRALAVNRDWPLLGLLALGFVGMGLVEASAGVLWADVLRGFAVSQGNFGFAMAFAVGLAFPMMIFGGRLSD